MTILEQRLGAGRRHVPASHPVLNRIVTARYRADLAAAMERADSRATVSATAQSEVNARLEDLAHRVVLLPDTDLSGQQRRSLIVIATELLRRAES